jgi:hypothetical protein
MPHCRDGRELKQTTVVPGRSSVPADVNEHVERTIPEALRSAHDCLLVGEVDLEDTACNCFNIESGGTSALAINHAAGQG